MATTAKTKKVYAFCGGKRFTLPDGELVSSKDGFHLSVRDTCLGTDAVKAACAAKEVISIITREQPSGTTAEHVLVIDEVSDFNENGGLLAKLSHVPEDEEE